MKTQKKHEGIKYQRANMGLTVFIGSGAADKNGGPDKQTQQNAETMRSGKASRPWWVLEHVLFWPLLTYCMSRSLDMLYA